jgi:glycosyltransferase involved in cell wall biosynthesis
MKVTHVIAGLSMGGAQTMLYKLLSRLDRAAFESEVVSLADVGPLDEKIRALGVPVKVLGMRPGVPNPLALFRLARWWRQDPPDVVQTWMYHADLIGGLAANLAGGIPVAWNIRHSDVDVDSNKRSTAWTITACARLSHWLPTRIICCAELSRRIHTQLGYAAEKILVIPNGFDLEVFRPDATARLSVRQDLGIPEKALVIGLVGRFHPLKDHRNFIESAARLHASLPEVHFLLCGDDVTTENPELAEWIQAGGIGDRCHLLGPREDVPRLNAALDIACCSSYSEGFPNAVGEAMACGVPCAVTDVGDSALIVGDTGSVVPPKNPDALANAWRELIEIGPDGRGLLGAAARRRIDQCFSLRAIAARYEDLYAQIAAHGRNRYCRQPVNEQTRAEHVRR